MNSVRELAKLGDRSAQLGLGLVEAPREFLVLIGFELRPQEAQREREPDQTLLGAVVEVAFQPAALGVARFDDASTRGAEILELRAHFGLETLVLEREARRGRNLLDELRIVEEAGPVEKHCDGSAVAEKGRRGAPLRSGEIDRAPARVRVAALAHRVRDLELRIGKRPGERLP